MNDLKEFCKESTAHGVRYFVDDKTSRLEKLVWACLVITTLYGTVNYLQYYWKNHNTSPFVTSFSSIPIRDVPFPAVSVKATQAITIPPWLIMATKVLDNVKYDCLSEKEECMNQTRVVRRHFGDLVARAVYKNFDSLINVYDIELNKKESNQLCALMMKLFGKPATSVIYSLVELLETTTEKIDLRFLAAEIFRIPKSLALTKMEQFLQGHGKNVTVSSISAARLTLTNSSKETQAKMFALIASQGNANPKLSLGSFIYTENVLKNSHQQGHITNEGAQAVFKVVEDLLAKNKSFSEIGLYALGEYSSNAEIYQSCSIIKNLNLHVCSIYKDEVNLTCCMLFNKTLAHYKSLIRILKYHMRPKTWEIRGKSYVIDIEGAIDMLPYVKEERKYFNQGQLPEIFHSKYFGNRLIDDPNPACHFVNIFSKEGLTNTFNAPYFWSVYKNNFFTRAYFNELYSKIEECHKNLEASPLHATSYGQHYAFEAIIPTSETGGEVIELHSPFDVPDLSSRPIHISPGKTYTITVTPSKYEVDLKLDDNDMTKLGCLSGKNHNLTLYKDYSQSKCQFECNLRRATKKCGCTPWNYPHIDEEVPTCLEYKHACFVNALSLAQEDYEACDCPPACNRIHYGYNIDTAHTDLYRICTSHWERMGLDKRKWSRNKALEVRDIKNVKQFLEEEFPPDPCHTLLPKMAFVQVYMATPDVSVALTSLKATLPDHVAAFGITIM